MNQLREFKSEFDPLFLDYISNKVATLPSVPYFDALGRQLLELARGGKRLRPYVAAVAAGNDGPKMHERLVPLGYALELFQLFALIHDDIIDRASERHGVECIHTKFNSEQAILIGDSCLTWAYEALHVYQDVPEILKIFSQLAQETMIGQMLDVALVKNIRPTTELLDQVVEYKTSRYTFIYPILLGRVISGFENDQDQYVEFGRCLGDAFQRLDDLADVLWGQEQLGKLPGADIAQGVPTHLSYLIQSHNSEGIRQEFARMFGQPTAVDSAAARSLFRAAGAIATEKAHIACQLERAAEILLELKLSDQEQHRWQPCLDFLQSKLNTF